MKLNQMTTLMMSSLFVVALSACGTQPQMMQVRQPVRVQSQMQTPATQQILVRFRDQLTRARAAEFSAKYGINIRQYLPALNVYVVEVSAELGLRPDKVVSFLQQDPMVAHAEVNLQVQVKPVVTEMQIDPIY